VTRSRASLTLLLGVAAVAAVLSLGGQRAGASSAAGHCAFQVGISQTNGVATSVIHVVQDNCQLSLVSITNFAIGSAIYDTATGTFAASDVRYKLSVQLPCDRPSETDLVLGPPTLYPPQDLDYGATPFRVACPSGGGGPTGGGGGSGGGGSGGGGGGGGGGTTVLPDLATTVHGSVAKGLRLGQRLTATVTVANKGKAAAGGVHTLISLSANAIPKLPAHATRGPGCTGVTVLDCDLGSLPSGQTATITLSLTAQTGKNLIIGAQAQEIENDATLFDNTGSLILALSKRLVPLKVTAIAGKITAHQQLAYLSLSRHARVTAQVYVAGHAKPITWRRTYGAGTAIVRIPLPALAKGQHFSIVFRAKDGTATSSTRLKLVVH
jgi:hypothetical protein